MKHISGVIILNFDGVADKNGDFFSRSAFIRWDAKDVPLINDRGVQVGTATPLQKAVHRDAFMVDLLFYDREWMPSYKDLKPCFNGKCLQRLAGHVLEARFMSVTLHPENADSRINTLGWYLGFDEQYKETSRNCTCVRLLNGHEDGCGWKNGKN